MRRLDARVCVLGLLALGCTQVALGQTDLPVPSVGGSSSGVGTGGSLANIGSGGARGARGGSSGLKLRATASLLVSDNISARTSAEGKDFGALLRVGPGLNWTRASGSLQASVDYSLFFQRYLKTEQRGRDVQHALRASTRAELVPQHLNVDAQATISQQASSAFGVQRASSDLNNVNSSEVGTLSLAPSLRFRLGGVAQSELRHILTTTRVRDSNTGDTTTQTSSAVVNALRAGNWGWGLQGTHQQNQPRGGRKTQSTQARVNVNWRPDVDWSATAFAGKERSNFSSLNNTTGNNYGGTVSWQPTPRTRALIGGEHRVFGNLYSASLEQRFARSSIRVSDNRTVNQPGLVGSVANSTNYDLLFAQLGSVEPDSVRRDTLVRETLARLGLSPDAQTSSGFLTNRTSVSRQRQLAASHQQVRGTAGLILSHTRTSRLDSLDLGLDDLGSSSFVNSYAAALNYGYRLTPSDSLSFTASWQRNTGASALQASSVQAWSLAWSGRLAVQTQVSVSFRHSQSESALRPVTENAVLATLQQQF